ncbi:hypothetical protein HPP92_024550 [Vanilla planifolia]|uniref:Uncharacterized protein n=1 Tax=Vanilla planifolia TaxID=51239 RepID=A0A835PVE1_VANPL|nr:hypothetical protein HPP92_024550 [Vanilla planifolia]
MNARPKFSVIAKATQVLTCFAYTPAEAATSSELFRCSSKQEFRKENNAKPTDLCLTSHAIKIEDISENFHINFEPNISFKEIPLAFPVLLTAYSAVASIQSLLLSDSSPHYNRRSPKPPSAPTQARRNPPRTAPFLSQTNP